MWRQMHCASKGTICAEFKSKSQYPMSAKVQVVYSPPVSTVFGKKAQEEKPGHILSTYQPNIEEDGPQGSWV